MEKEKLDHLIFKTINYESRRKGRSRYTRLRWRKHPQRILIKSSPFVITVNEQDEVEVLTNQSIYIEGSEIKALYPAGEEPVSLPALDLIYEAGARGGIVITPGLINTHAHPTMYLMRSAMLLDYGQHLDETIAKMPLWQKFIRDRALLISILGDLTEQQKSGITTTLNHNAIFAEVDEAAEICGQRIVNCVSAVSNSQPDITLETVRAYLESDKRELSTAGIAIHYLYKVEEDLLREIKQLQDKHHALLTIHFAESQGVAERCVKKFGRRETKLLEQHGLLNRLTLLAHGLAITDEEIRVLVKSQTGIAHLPTSNAIHKSGVFDYPKFAEYGGTSRIALGTDSVVSKSRLDLLTEAFQTRMTHLPGYTVYYEDLFKMITINGARALNFSNLGRIAPGYKADLAFWKLKDRGFLPFDEKDPKTLVGNIISHGGRNIRDLMINGRFVISNRVHNLVNESELLMEIQKAHMAVRGQVEAEKNKQVFLIK